MTRRPPKRDHLVKRGPRTIRVYAVVREAVKAGDTRDPEALNDIAAAALALLAIVARGAWVAS